MSFVWRITDYPEYLRDAPDDAHRERLLIYGLPRWFHQATPAERVAALADPPRLTGTPWDALLAAVTEHVAVLHGMPVPSWCNEPERFLEEPWVLPDNPVIAADARAKSPAAFVRHGTLIDPWELDHRGGEPDVG